MGGEILSDIFLDSVEKSLTFSLTSWPDTAVAERNSYGGPKPRRQEGGITAGAGDLAASGPCGAWPTMKERLDIINEEIRLHGKPKRIEHAKEKKHLVFKLGQRGETHSVSLADDGLQQSNPPINRIPLPRASYRGLGSRCAAGGNFAPACRRTSSSTATSSPACADRTRPPTPCGWKSVKGDS